MATTAYIKELNVGNNTEEIVYPVTKAAAVWMDDNNTTVQNAVADLITKTNYAGLTKVTTATSGNYIPIMVSNNNRAIDYNDLAKAIIENYNSSTIAGQAQSIKQALDTLRSNLAVNSIANYSTLLTHVKSLAKGVYCIRADNATDAPVGEGVIYTIYKTHPVNDTRAIIVGIPMKTSEDQPIYTAFIGQNASSITWSTNFNLYKGQLPNNTDLLTVNTPGIYLLSGVNTYVNCPSTYGVFEVLKHVTTSSNSLRLYRITTVDTVYIRYYTNDSTTGSWIKLPQRNEIDSINNSLNALNSSQAGIKTVFKGTVSSESPVQIPAYTAHTIFLIAIGTWTNSRLLAAFPNNSGEPIVRVICAKQNTPEDIYSVTANGAWGLTISTTSTTAMPLTVIAIIKNP